MVVVRKGARVDTAASRMFWSRTIIIALALVTVPSHIALGTPVVHAIHVIGLVVGVVAVNNLLGRGAIAGMMMIIAGIIVVTVDVIMVVIATEIGMGIAQTVLLENRSRPIHPRLKNEGFIYLVRSFGR